MRMSIPVVVLSLIFACSGQENRGEARQEKNELNAVRVVPASSTEILRAIGNLDAETVVVNVWATHCPPCREEFPDLLQLRRNFGPLGMKLLLVAVDPETSTAKVQEFLASQNVDFPTYIRSDHDLKFVGTFDPRWTGALPATWIYDSRGTLRHFWEGRRPYRFMEDKVTEVMNGGIAREGIFAVPNNKLR
jgi:thiol-disulfide isomerase/thioredoxin